MTAIRSVFQRTGLLLLCPLLFLYLRGRKRFAIGAILSLAMFILGCFQHYYTKSISYSADPALIERLRVSNKIFLAHYPDTLVLWTNMRTDNKQIQAENRPLDADLRAQSNPDSIHKRTYRPATEPTVPSQVHIYIQKPLSTYITSDSITSLLPFTQIQKIEIYEKDIQATNGSRVLGVTGIVVLTVGLSFLIMALVCNCPQVYVDESGGYAFKGGMYSGSIMSTTERTDYMILDNFPVSQAQARIRIDNVKGETQHINQLRLLTVRHPEGSKVLVDRHGKPFSYTNPIAPEFALSGSGMDIRKEVLAADGLNAFFDERQETKASTVILRFPASMAGKKARLILHGFNTGWAGFLNQQFHGYFGRYYDTWRSQQEKKDPKAMETWMLKQSLPIKIYVRQASQGWQMADYIPLAGNTAMRKHIVELDLPPTNGSTVDIKLETVYNFWQIDYAALDASEQSAIQTEWIAPIITQPVNASAHADNLAKIDHQYVVLQGNESLNLEFTLPAHRTGQQTFFLAGTGYYHQPPATEGRPDIGKLIAFRKPGAFQSFSISETRKMETAMTVHQATRGRDR